jgi:hypothetical protein
LLLLWCQFEAQTRCCRCDYEAFQKLSEPSAKPIVGRLHAIWWRC